MTISHSVSNLVKAVILLRQQQRSQIACATANYLYKLHTILILKQLHKKFLVQASTNRHVPAHTYVYIKYMFYIHLSEILYMMNIPGAQLNTP